MRLTIRLFAVLRERIGASALDLDLPGEQVILKDLLVFIEQKAPTLGPLLRHSRVAVNEAFAAEDTIVREGDAVALLPPVSGGAGMGPFRLQSEPVDPSEVLAAVARDSAGATVIFVGTVRDGTDGEPVLALEYEAYEEMATTSLRSLGEEVRQRWPQAVTAAVHRTGRVAVGEVAVALAVSAPNRAEAFEACRFALERLKADVPVWKKEHRKSGAIWVGAPVGVGAPETDG